MNATSAARDRILAEFDRAARSLPGSAERRRAAMARFDFPAADDESWRFTDTTALEETAFAASAPGDPASVAALARGPLQASQAVFVDGRYAPSLSTLPRDVAVESLAGREPSGEAAGFAALNSAFSTDGALVRVGPGVTAKDPLHLLFLSTPSSTPRMSHPRIEVSLGEGACAAIVEDHAGPAGAVYLGNVAARVDVGPGAELDYVRIQRDSTDAFHVGRSDFHLGRGAVLRHSAFALGARFSRHDLGVLLDEGSDLSLDGLYRLDGRRIADTHSTIDHAAPSATSRELYKGVLDGESRGVFDGRVVVREGARGSNAVQHNANLLLSRKALIHTKPQLEILADDVKCRHGATVGRLDEAALFYLRSRGLGAEQARLMLIAAFARQIVDGVRVPAARELLGGGDA